MGNFIKDGSGRLTTANTKRESTKRSLEIFKKFFGRLSRMRLEGGFYFLGIVKHFLQ